MADLISRIEKQQLGELSLDKRLKDADFLAGRFFPDLLSALEQQGGKKIHTVGLSDIFCDKLSQSDFIKLLKAVQQLSGLKKLRLSVRYISHHDIPLPIFEPLVKKAPLLSLKVARGFVLRHQDDVNRLALALHSHATLNEVSLMDLDVAGYVRDGNSAGTTSIPPLCMDPVFWSLSTIPHLESVDISMSSRLSQSMQRISNRCLYAVCGHRLFTNEPMSSFEVETDVEKENSSCESRQADILASSLKCNSLEDPDFRGAYRPVATFQPLQDISLWECGLDDEHVMEAIVPALGQKSCSLQFLSLRRNPGISGLAWQALLSVIEQANYTLTSLYGDHQECHRRHQHDLLPPVRRRLSNRRPEEIDSVLVADSGCYPNVSSSRGDDFEESLSIWLRLNGLGRGLLLTHSFADESQLVSLWINMLVQVSDCPTSLYYIVRVQPDLFTKVPQIQPSR